MDNLGGKKILAVTYFRERGAHYHWRERFSLLSSVRDQVGPRGYGRQETGCVLKDT